jgi:hypothetical protein
MWGMPQSVTEFDVTEACLAFTPCDISRMYATPNSEGTDSDFSTTYQFPDSFAIDARYGARWHGAFVQMKPDLLWQPPHPRCDVYLSILEDTEETPVFQMQSDNGFCLDDVPDNTPPVYYYAHAPMIEARNSLPTKAAVPYDAPDLQPDTYITYLTLSDLDVDVQPDGLIAPPPGPVGPGPDNTDAVGAVETPWTLAAAEAECITADGRFDVEYEANNLQ